MGVSGFIRVCEKVLGETDCGFLVPEDCLFLGSGA